MARRRAYATDPRVDAYVEALPAWQQAICRRVRDVAAINAPALLAMLHQIIANNRAGGWRKLKAEETELPR